MYETEWKKKWNLLHIITYTLELDKDGVYSPNIAALWDRVQYFVVHMPAAKI
jgi:hypothetical protein